MRAGCLLLVVAVFALAGCRDSDLPSTEEVVRSWSAALNSGDNEAAGELFAQGARIEQAGLDLRVTSRQVAVDWNASLPCSGRIVALETDGDVANATFLLGDRKTSRCDAPGSRATAEFTVRDGMIVRWRQTGGQEAPRVDAV